MGYLNPNKVVGVMIHCSDTYSHMDTDAATIKRWHTTSKEDGGRGWSDIGYHWVIKRDGTIEEGRSVKKTGAHCRGKNATHLGICLIGGRGKDNKAEDNFTNEQWDALIGKLKELPANFPNIEEICGHNEYSSKKCPSFDVQEWKKQFNIHY